VVGSGGGGGGGGGTFAWWVHLWRGLAGLGWVLWFFFSFFVAGESCGLSSVWRVMGTMLWVCYDGRDFFPFFSFS